MGLITALLKRASEHLCCRIATLLLLYDLKLGAYANAARDLGAHLRDIGP